MKKIYFPFLVATIIGIGLVCAAPGPKPRKSHDASFTRNLTLFNSLATELEKNYVDSIRTDEAFKAAISAMLNTVDPYTEYYDSDDKDALELMTSGSYGGIGAIVLSRNKETYISEPIEDAPAHKAGLKAGDLILSIDSIATSGMPVNDVTKLLKGQPGTSFTLKVKRPYATDSILSFNITREKVQEKSVPYWGVFGNTGYIQLSSFLDKSPEEVEKALKAFKENPEVRGIVLDLRGNGGGLVESAINILGNFLPKGTEVLRTRGKIKSAEKIYKTTHKPLFPDIPLAVLIDGGSASASEITAGALQDLDRAVLIGSNSYGKGLVQSTFNLPYDALLKVTIAKYYTPSGRLIQALDYSHRNPDGTVARTPDSLTHVFKTLNGREVRDGGGLSPDSVISWKEPSRLLFELVSKNMVFDYATRYAATHPLIEPAEIFRISDEDFEDFCAGLDTTQLKASHAGLENLDKLRQTAKTEGYASEELSRRLDSIAPFFAPDLQRDLRVKKSQISELLANEIASRYYLGRGRAASELINDNGLSTAISILNDPVTYKKLLSPDRKTNKKSGDKK